jgi:hypothetical protein
MDDVVVADDWADLTDETLDAPINVDELGQTIASVYVWTATWADGTFIVSSDCSDWTSQANGETGAGGRTDATNYDWTAYYLTAVYSTCDLGQRLYCFEQ